MVGVLGILLVALPLLVGGIVITVGVSRWSALDPEAQGRVPGDLTVETEEGSRYVVALGTGLVNETGGGRSFHTGYARDVRCTITHPDGSEDSIRGDRQGSAVERTGEYASVGEFDGQGGETSVACTVTSETVLGDEPDLPMIVHDLNTTLRWIGFGMIGGGVVALLGCVGLVLWGARGRPA